MTGMLAQMLGSSAQGADEDAGSTLALVTAPEAERMIEQLKFFKVEDVGSPRWQTQREWMDRLNCQAHTNASTNSDEFVVELLVSLDKMKAVVHELLAIEAWKQHVFPHLKHHLANKLDSSYPYLVLLYEGILANLLELALYHLHACEALPEEYLLELADWAYRKLTYLASPDGRKQAAAGARNPRDLLALSPLEELEERAAEVEFSTAMCAVTITRYLADGIIKLPMGLMSRMTTTNDFPMVLVALLNEPPWTRRNAKGKQEKWQGNAWKVVEPADRLKLIQADAQVWLTLNSLVVEPRCRAKYGHDEWRRDKLFSLKRYMNELLFDQVPVLKDLQRTLDEMALGVGPDSNSMKSAALILEVVPEIRDNLLKEMRDAKVLAIRLAGTYFSEAESKRHTQQQMESFIKQLQFLSDAQEQQAAKQAGKAEEQVQPVGLGPVRINCWRKAHDSGVFESWCDFSLEVDTARAPTPVTLEHLHAVRHMLVPLDPATTRALPTQGKIVVKIGYAGGAAHDDSTAQQDGGAAFRWAEALLDLPDIPLKSMAGEKPAVVWVNVGLLAEDGLVLQLKLKRRDVPSERDKVSGLWYAYHPVGGAITVLREEAGPGQQAAAQGQAETLIPAVGLQGISNAGKGGVSAGHKVMVQDVGKGGAARRDVADGKVEKRSGKLVGLTSAAPAAVQSLDLGKRVEDQGKGQAAGGLAGQGAGGSGRPLVQVMQPVAAVRADTYEDLELPD